MKLPTELVHESLSFCALADLAVLSRINTAYQNIAEKWLYRFIPYLDKPNLSICLTTIGSRPKIAQHIRKLSIEASASAFFQKDSLLHRVLQCARNITSLTIWTTPNVGLIFVGCSFNLTTIHIIGDHMEGAFKEWLSTQSNLASIRIISTGRVSSALDHTPLQFERLRDLSISPSLAHIFLPHNRPIKLAITLPPPRYATPDLICHTPVPNTIAYLVMRLQWWGADVFATWAENTRAIVSSLPELVVLKFDLDGSLDDDAIDKFLLAVPGIITTSPNLRGIMISRTGKPVPIDVVSKWHQRCPQLHLIFILPIRPDIPSDQFVRVGDCWSENQELSLRIMEMANYDGEGPRISSKEGRDIKAYFEAVNVVMSYIEGPDLDE